MAIVSRTLLIVFAGLFGALGVGGAALAAHGGDNRMIAIAAALSLVHAPALLALAALPADLIRLRLPAGLALILGTLLFSGDLAMRSFTGERLFPDAAPAGGMILIAGWLLVVVGAVLAAVLGRRAKQDLPIA